MLASPETAEYTRRNSIENEVHGVSLRTTRQLGHLANLLAERELKDHQVYHQAKGEFESRIFEGLSTDEEHGEKLRVTKFDHLPVIAGKVMVADEHGWASITEILQNGLDSAEAEAWEDPRKWTHFNRALNDAHNGFEVDEMVAGNRDYNTRLVVSCDPAAAIMKDGVKHWEKEGYVEDLCYWQLYHYSGDKLFKGSLSFYARDKEIIREVCSKHGVEIPEDAAVDDYIQYAIEDNFEDEEEAKAFVLDLREACDQSTGKSKSDTVDGLEINQEVMDSVFDEMHMPVDQSLDEKKKNARTHEIAESFLNNSSNYSSDVRRGLIKICNSNSFDDDDKRLIQKLIDYSAIEKLRSTIEHNDERADELGWSKITMSVHDNRSLDAFLFEMSMAGAAGASEGRSYSSCGGGISVAAEGGLQENTRQETYGGKVCNKEVKNGDSVKCPHCYKRVKAVVQSRGKIECSNNKCTKAAASVKTKAV